MEEKINISNVLLMAAGFLILMSNLPSPITLFFGVAGGGFLMLAGFIRLMVEGNKKD